MVVFAQLCDCTSCHCMHSLCKNGAKTVKMVSFMLHIFSHDTKKNTRVSDDSLISSIIHRPTQPTTEASPHFKETWPRSTGR